MNQVGAWATGKPQDPHGRVQNLLELVVGVGVRGQSWSFVAGHMEARPMKTLLIGQPS